MMLLLLAPGLHFENYCLSVSLTYLDRGKETFTSCKMMSQPELKGQ